VPAVDPPHDQVENRVREVEHLDAVAKLSSVYGCVVAVAVVDVAVNVSVADAAVVIVVVKVVFAAVAVAVVAVGVDGFAVVDVRVVSCFAVHYDAAVVVGSEAFVSVVFATAALVIAVDEENVIETTALEVVHHDVVVVFDVRECVPA